MKKQHNFKFYEHVMDMLRGLATSNGMSNTAILELLIIQARSNPMYTETFEHVEYKDDSQCETLVVRVMSDGNLNAYRKIENYEHNPILEIEEITEQEIRLCLAIGHDVTLRYDIAKEYANDTSKIKQKRTATNI